MCSETEKQSEATLTALDESKPFCENDMIQSKEEYTFYLEADRTALGIDHIRPRLFQDEVWKFERLLRTTEYIENCENDQFHKIYLYYLRFRLHRLSLKLGFSIPRNVFGPGLSIAHYGPIIVNGGAKVGSNCRIHHCVTIGTKAGTDRSAPKIGNNVYIGPGAVIVNSIQIANDIAIGANSYVGKSFEESGITVAGIPARKVSSKGSRLNTSRFAQILQKYNDLKAENRDVRGCSNELTAVLRAERSRDLIRY
jgi:serine O-acetyltransferase